MAERNSGRKGSREPTSCSCGGPRYGPWMGSMAMDRNEQRRSDQSAHACMHACMLYSFRCTCHSHAFLRFLFLPDFFFFLPFVPSLLPLSLHSHLPLFCSFPSPCCPSCSFQERQMKCPPLLAGLASPVCLLSSPVPFPSWSSASKPPFPFPLSTRISLPCLNLESDSFMISSLHRICTHRMDTPS